MPLTYIPKDKGKKKKPRFGAGTSYDYLSRQEKSAVNQLNDLAGEGLLNEFAAYREDGPGLAGAAWNALKKGGSAALDVVSRAGYAAGGAMEEAFQGNAGNIPARVGTELFSGIGGLKGQKELPSDVLRQETNYGQWSEEHPILSMGTDLAADVALDPSTYAGGLLAKGGAKLLSKGGKGIQWVASKTKTGEKIADTLGRTFDPAHLWKKAGAEKGYDIVWQEGKFADALRQKYGKEIEPIVKALRDRNFTPPQVAEFIRVGYGDIPIEQASQQTQALMPQVRDLFKTMGRRDYRYIGKDPAELMIEYYLPNRPMAYNELMSTAGKRSMTGYGVPGGFKDLNKPFQKGKTLTEGEDVIGFMKSKGVSPKDMGEAMARSIETRAGESVAKIRVIRTHNRLINELPDDFRKLEPGTRVPWDKQLQAGESLWMPAGNIRMYITQLKDVIPDSIMERLLVMADEGGIVSEDFLKLIEKEVPRFTTRVPVYAVKTEIAEALTQLSHGMGKGTIVDWWDKVLGSFKNTAILWPGFHLRNLEASTAQNYIAGVKPEIYDDVKKVLTSKNGNEIVLGKSVDGWKNIMTRNGVLQGGFVGQMTGKATGAIGKIAEPVFEKNRAIGQHIEDISRAALFMDRVQKGLDPLEAAKAVKRFHFDYGELTGFEKTIARRAIPFYAWCVSEDTECLTWYGWRKYNQIALGDIILTYNVSKKEFEWKPVQDKFEAPYNYKLMHFKGKSMDLLCTFDHKCVTENGLKKAYEIAQNDIVPMKVNYHADDYSIPDNILKIICWTITDGYSRMRGNHFEAVIYQKKPRHVAAIRELLGDNCHESVHPDTGVTCFHINGNLRNKVYQWFSCKKGIWDLFVRLSPHQMAIAKEIMMNAEGSCSYEDTNKEFEHFSQKPGVVRDAFQLLTILGGTISNCSGKGVYIRNKPTAKYPKPEIVDYNGIIWCPTTENDTWVARRNGKVIVTGNTRKNTPLQLEMIFKAPNKYRNIAYLKHAVAGGKYDENAPEWWEQQDVWQTKFKDSQGNRLAVSMGLPYADLNMLSGNPAGMLGPASTLMNAVNNYDAFLERPIQSFKGEKKPLLTIGNFQLDQIPGLNNPKVLYALQGLIPISKRYGTDLSAEISRIFTGKEKPDDKYRAVAKLIGVRVLPNVKSEAEKRKILMLLEDLREFKKYREQEGAR